MDLLQAIAGLPYAGPILPYLALLIAVCALIAMCIPPPADNAGVVYKFVYALINTLAANMGHAANLTKPLLLMLAIGLTLTIAACSPGAIQTAQQDVGIARNAAQSVLNVYPIIKGMAQVAAIADPALAPIIEAAIAAIEPNAVKAQAALNMAGSTAPVLIGLAGTLTQQVHALTATAAPAVKVVAGK